MHSGPERVAEPGAAPVGGPPGGEAGAGGAVDGPLSASEIHDRQVETATSELIVTDPATGERLRLRFAGVSQRGFYPDSPDKPNQDSWGVSNAFGGDPNQLYVGVYDGHGPTGHFCAQHAAERVPANLQRVLKRGKVGVAKGFEQAMVSANREMHVAQFDDDLSGTTAICSLIQGLDCYVANVGDSRCIVGRDEGGRLVASALSSDQTPYRRDERERCRREGARILTMDQLEGLKPVTDDWDLQLGEELDDDGDPPRIWAQHEPYPGAAFTRSLGDAIAEGLGVFAEPEVLCHRLSAADKFLVLASDGVFEFLTNQAVADTVAAFGNPLDACHRVVQNAYDLWLRYEVRTDDITMVCVFVEPVDEDPSPPPPPPDTPASPGTPRTPAPGHEARPVRRTMSRKKREVVMSRSDTLYAGAPSEFVLEEHITPKSDEERAHIMAAVAPNFLFSHLAPSQMDVVVGLMEKIDVRTGDVVIHQGDEGDRFYVAESGQYDVFVQGNPQLVGVEMGAKVHTYSCAGSAHPSFGELALLYSKPRAASVTAATDGQLWGLRREAFSALLLKRSNTELVRILRSVNVLSSLNTRQLQRLGDVLTELSFRDGEYIIRQGAEGDTMYVLTRGAVVCTITDRATNVSTEVLRLGVNDFFGERALLQDEPRAANVIAVGATSCLAVSRRAFEEVLGPLADIIAAETRRREQADMQERPPVYFASTLGHQHVQLSDLERRHVVAVEPWFELAQYQDRQRAHAMYTMRRMPKACVDSSVLQTAVMNERAMLEELTQTQSTGVPTMLATFTDPHSLYVLFEATYKAPLAAVAADLVGDDAAAQFYVACAVLALERLHEDHFIYRALCPDFMLLQDNGYAALADFRFARQLEPGSRTFTICGTPEYLAPEVISSAGHDRAADLWALGVFAYELLTGASPFAVEQGGEMAVYAKVAAHDGSTVTAAGASVSVEALSFISELLQPDPVRRLGYNGEVRGHRWLRRLDWIGMEGQNVAAPEAGLRVAPGAGVEDELPQQEPYTGSSEWCAGF